MSTSSFLNALLCYLAFFGFSFLSQPQEFAVLGIPPLTLVHSHIVCPPWVIPFTTSVSTITQMLITSCLLLTYLLIWASWVVLVVKNLPANAEDIRDAGLIPGLGRFPPLLIKK